MASMIDIVWLLLSYSYGLVTYFQYLCLALYKSRSYGETAEKDHNEFLLARDQFWNLSKSVYNLRHRFFVVRGGKQLHYLTNVEESRASVQQKSTLIVLIHGFPDSSLLWRHIAESQLLQQNAVVVAVDLPGTGGSDSLDKYGASEVLGALTEFIIAMQERYLEAKHEVVTEKKGPPKKVIVVGHDWGCLLAYRLAVEGPPGIAHRYILTNAPHAALTISNKDRALESAKAMLFSFLRSPGSNYHCLLQAVDDLKPLLKQLLRFGYMFAFQLPRVMVKLLATIGNSSFPRMMHNAQYRADRADFNPHHSMAVSVGPGKAECRTETNEARPQTYGPSVLGRAREAGCWFVHFTAYYRDGAALDEWEKSSDIDFGTEDNSKISNSKGHQPSTTLSNAIPRSCTASLRAPATIVWGEKDTVCAKEMCLDGIGDYLIQGSQVVILPDAGHWTPLERKSRRFLQAILETATQKDDIDQNDVETLIDGMYPTASLSTIK